MADDQLPSEFDLIVIGTGMTESILSAAASRIGKTVLHLDSNDFYGGSWASFNLETIENLARNNSCVRSNRNITINNGIIHTNNDINCIIENAENEWRIPANTLEIGNKTDDEKIDGPSEEDTDEREIAWTKEKVMQDFRKFNIDLTPKLLYGRGDLVELLITSNIARYAEFRAVDRILTCIDNEMKVVPCSRADVFTNRNVTVLEKRLLMKILTNCMNNNDNENEFKDFSDKTFRAYLEHKRLTPNLIHYILYAIGMSDDQTSCSDGVNNVKRFLKSLGRYGNTSFLFPMYGCGEVPQCFCRLSAVFGGIYCLKKPIEEIHFNETFKEFSAIKCNDQLIKGKSIVISGCGLNQLANIFTKSNTDTIEQTSNTQHNCGKLSRAIFITNKPLCNEIGNLGGGVEFLKLPMIDEQFTSVSNESSGAFVIQLSHWSGTVPNGLYLIHVTCRTRSDTPKSDIDPYERMIFERIDAQAILWSMYFNIPSCLKCTVQLEMPANFHVACGPYFELDYEKSIQEAKRIFRKLYGDEEFLPRAPDPDEIIIEGDNPTDPSPSIVQEFVSSTREPDEIEPEANVSADHYPQDVHMDDINMEQDVHMDDTNME